MEVLVISNSKGDLLINDQIKAKEVLVVGPKGEQLGVKTISDALTLASYAAYDLVLISPNSNPPVCKIMEKANMSQLKEYRLSPTIDVGDFETKLRNVTKYLEKGDRIKVSVRFKGRQMAHTELGEEVLNRFASKLEGIADVQEKPKLEGRQMTMLLVPKKEK